MTVQHAIEVAGGGAALLAICGFFAQTAADTANSESLTTLGAIAQIGSAGLVLYTVRMFLQDRKEREAAIAMERKEFREDYAVIMSKVETLQKLAHEELMAARTEQRQFLEVYSDRLEAAITLLRGVKCDQQLLSLQQDQKSS